MKNDIKKMFDEIFLNARIKMQVATIIDKMTQILFIF
jgi:hypothetical protein